MSNVAVRKKEVYQTDDSRMIIVYTKAKDIPFDPLDTSMEIEELEEISQEESLYVGVIKIPLEYFGVKEIEFQIENVTTIEEALRCASCTD